MGIPPIPERVPKSAHFLRTLYAKTQIFLAHFLESAETPLFVLINVSAVWALRLDRKYTHVCYTKKLFPNPLCNHFGPHSSCNRPTLVGQALNVDAVALMSIESAPNAEGLGIETLRAKKDILATRAAIYRSLWALRARYRKKKLSQRLFLGICRKVPENNRKSLKTPIFRPFRVFFKTFSGIFHENVKFPQLPLWPKLLHSFLFWD